MAAAAAAAVGGLKLIDVQVKSALATAAACKRMMVLWIESAAAAVEALAAVD